MQTVSLYRTRKEKTGQKAVRDRNHRTLEFQQDGSTGQIIQTFTIYNLFTPSALMVKINMKKYIFQGMGYGEDLHTPHSRL
jgi:hypothetical protein